jgi:hypothetical protein
VLAAFSGSATDTLEIVGGEGEGEGEGEEGQPPPAYNHATRRNTYQVSGGYFEETPHVESDYFGGSSEAKTKAPAAKASEPVPDASPDADVPPPPFLPYQDGHDDIAGKALIAAWLQTGATYQVRSRGAPTTTANNSPLAMRPPQPPPHPHPPAARRS